MATTVREAQPQPVTRYKIRVGMFAWMLPRLTGLALVGTGSTDFIKYTWVADATGDGRVNADDYFQIYSHYNDGLADATTARGERKAYDPDEIDDFFIIDGDLAY